MRFRNLSSNRPAIVYAVGLLLAAVVGRDAAAQTTSPSVPGPFVPLAVARIKASPPQIVVTPPDSGGAPAAGTVILGSFEIGKFLSVPLARFQAAAGTLVLDQDREPALFSPEWSATPSTMRAWLVRDDASGLVKGRWPAGADFIARVDSIGPGRAAAWLDVGAKSGVSTGDVFLKSVGVQPVARLEVRSVLDEVAYCRITYLAKGAAVSPGDVVTAWPAPADTRDGRCRSTVCFVESMGDAQVLWIARPPRAAVPREPRMELTRYGRYMGFATVERQDALFWYARTLPSVSVGPIRVGDTAEIRTLADISAPRISARVFDQNEHGALITAGENDGLSAGLTATALRGDRLLGLIEVIRVTGGYATIRMQAGADAAAAHSTTAPAEPPMLERLDEIRFGPPRLPDRIIGRVVRLEGDALTLDLTSPVTPRPGDLLSLRVKDATIAVALVLETAEGRAVAFLLAESWTAPISGGTSVAAPVP